MSLCHKFFQKIGLVKILLNSFSEGIHADVKNWKIHQREEKKGERERKRKEEEEGKKRKENYSFINTGTKMAYKILANRISLNMIKKKSLEKNQSVQFSSVQSLSRVRLFSTPGIKAHQASLSSFCLFMLFMGFSRQEYWSGLPFPSPVDHILSDLSSWPVHLGWPHMAWLSFIEYLMVKLCTSPS